MIRVPLEQPLDAPMLDEEERAEASLAEAKLLGRGARRRSSRARPSARARSATRSSSARSRLDADLIVLGSAPRWRRQSRFFSPTVDYVLRKAPCEVLIVAFPQSVMDEELAGDVVAADGVRCAAVKAIVIGCGRVGSNVALQLQGSGWDVTVVDENEDALGRLGESWTGGFLVGHGMDLQLLREAGIEEADAVVVTTDGDNTNLVIAQAAQKQFEVPTVVVRVLDPARAQFYATRGLRIVCPTSAAIETLVGAVREAERQAA